MASAMASYSNKMPLTLCNACERDDEQIDAIKWCKDCMEFLCEQCCIFHKRNKATSSHYMVLISEVTNGDIQASQLDMDTSCSLHQGKPIELYCVSHDQLCCATCAVTKHKECFDIIPIDDVVNKYTEGKHLELQITEFSKMASIMQKFIAEKKTGLNVLEESRAKIQTEVSNVVEAAKSKLDQLNVIFQKELLDTQQKARTLQESPLTAALTFHEHLSKCVATMETLRHVSHVSPKDCLTVVEKMKSDSIEKFKEIKEVFEKDTNFELKLKLNDYMKYIIDLFSNMGNVEREQLSIKSSEDVLMIDASFESLKIGLKLGSTAQAPVYDDSSSTTEHNACKANTDDDSSSTIEHNACKANTVVYEGLMAAKVFLAESITAYNLGLNHSTFFTDAKFHEEGELLLADYPKERVVMLDASFAFQRAIRVEGRPSTISISNDGEDVYVGVDDHECIVGYPLHGCNDLFSREDTNIEGEGVCISGDTTIAAQQNCVKLYDAYGIMRRRIQRKHRSNCWIAVSNDGERFYHSSGDTVLGRNLDGKVELYYNNDELKDPSGICVDGEDNVYVAGNQSRNIHQISKDGTKHRILLSFPNIINAPYALAFDRHRNRLVVTSNGEDVILLVYQLSNN